MTLEAVEDDILGIWHVLLGMPSSNNDINVFEASLIFDKIADRVFLVPVKCPICDTERNKP